MPGVDNNQNNDNLMSRMIQIPFSAYKGSDPFMFISYSHKDSSLVYPILQKFDGQGYHVWYDEGIEPGIEWPEEIGRALNGSSLFVVFITPNSASSENVRNEINFALGKKKPFIAIYLQPTELTPGLQLQIGSKQAILKYQMDEESFTRKYQYSFNPVLGLEQKPVPPQPVVQEEKKNPPAQPPQPLQPQPAVPVQQVKPAAGAIQFKCDVIRRAACAAIGFPEDRPLEQKHTQAVSELKFYGDFYGADYMTVMTKSPQHLFIHKRNGPPEITYDRGSITELTDFVHFPNLKYLTIPLQQFTDLSPLAGVALKTLDLSCNHLDDLTPLGTLKNLNNLTLDHATYGDLKALEKLPELILLSMIGLSYPSFQQLCTLNLNKLNNLKIAESKLESLEGISHLQGIDFLEIQRSTIFEFDDLANLPNLKFLLMTGTKCFDYSFLKRMPNLKSISVDEDQKPAIIDVFGEKPPFLK